MPKRTDIKSILLIGSGPIIIGQACEFDYAGTQAVRALKEEGYRVILVNSNPATIMTSPDLADSTYIEPLTRESLIHIIQQEQPDALLPTMGGQTALNLAKALYEQGDLQKYGVQLIGASVDAINKAENRASFYELMNSLGLRTPRSMLIQSPEQIDEVIQQLGLPLIIRPSFTLGGTGGGIAETKADVYAKCEDAFAHSIHMEVELSESLLGFKEYELEVVRDRHDNTIIVCSIENIQPMGVHTGDSATVAPQQTLTDREYQVMREQAFKIIRAVGVETGGSNVQFAVNPKTGEQFVIEMNPRVSRSSALASKATGFPIAKIAAKLAIGYTLDELANDMTNGLTPASFEPTLDYVVTKLPYFQFEKFGIDQPSLNTTMHAIGEVMAIGRTFVESFEKAVDSLECKDMWTQPVARDFDYRNPNALMVIVQALRAGIDADMVATNSDIDPWFIHQIARFCQAGDEPMYDRVYKHIDSCAAEFPVGTDYLYSTREAYCELDASDAKRVFIIGSGPNRIGQGIEFDYSCVEALQAAKHMGYETVMFNSNPETVSTDYDVADKLFFEPITPEYLLNAIERMKPEHVIVQFGGQTPINLLDALVEAKAPVHPALPEAIRVTEDREAFNRFLEKLKLNASPYQTVSSFEAAKQFVEAEGYPVLVRPSYVIGGKGMQRIDSEEDLQAYFDDPEIAQQLQIEIYFEDALEFDIDAISDGEHVLIAGILEHVDPLGVHSGDSIQVIPPYTASVEHQREMVVATQKIASALKMVGPFNIQMALHRDKLYIIEVNPRCSRSLPFIAKSTGIALAQVAMRCLLGQTLSEQGLNETQLASLHAVKVPIFVFDKFKDADILLGPEMKSTGEVMGLGLSLGDAAQKAMQAAYWPLAIDQIRVNIPSVEVLTEIEKLFPNSVIDVTGKLDIDQCDLIIDLKKDDKRLREQALRHEVCYINSLRVASLLAMAIDNRIGSLNSLQIWQQEVMNYAASTDDEARRGSITGRTRSLEESGAP